MTVSATAPRTVLSGNGVTKTFPTVFAFVDEADLVVIVRTTASGDEDLQVRNTDYTVSVATQEITFVTAPPSGTKVIIYIDPLLSQDFDPEDHDKLPAENLEAAFDKLTRAAQRHDILLNGRVIKLSEGYNAAFDATLPAVLSPSYYLRVNAAGTGFELVQNVTVGALTVSSYIQTLLDDANSATALGTLGAAASTQQVIAGDGLTGGGTLAADRTLALDASFLRGFISGLTLSNNVSDANNDIDIAAGVAVDGGNAAFMKLTSTLTKRLDAAWAVGTNQGGLDTGAEAISTWYHLWLIRRPDTGVVDALFSASATAPTMPANYTQKRRIGAVFNDASGNILAFTQIGDNFRLKIAANNVSNDTTNFTSTARLQTLTVPAGVKVTPLFQMFANSAATDVLVTSPDDNDQAVTTTNLTARRSVNGNVFVGEIGPTNTSSQLRFRTGSATASDMAMNLSTIGWRDTRGRFD